MKNIYKLAFVLTGSLMISCGGDANTEEEGSTDSTTAEIDTTSVEEEIVDVAGYQVGDIATDFSLMNIDDQMVSLADYTDAKGFIVTFTCNHCPYAVAYEDRIIELDETYKSQGYPVIAINPNDPALEPDDSFEEMKKRAADKGFTFPYLMDEGQAIYPQYGATKTPHVYVLEKTDAGNRVAYIGAIDDNHEEPKAVTETYVADAVDALLEGNQPAVTETKAIGCSIKTDK